jgi:cobalamin biosynthesis protein CobT
MRRQDVFRRKLYHEGSQVAITLLMDGSGSMAYNNRVLNAASLAIHLCEAVEGTGSTVQVLAFNDMGHYQRKHKCKDNGLTVALTEYKSPDERMASTQVKSTLASYSSSPRGGTSLCGGMWHAMPMLANRPGTKHIMFVLSDGECNLGAPMTKATIDLLRKKYPHVDLIGMGIELDVSEMFGKEHSVHVEDVSKLVTGGLQTLLRRLKG